MAIYLTVGTAGATLDQLNLPVGIFYDSVKNGIYVADTDNSRVMYFRVGNRNGTIVAGNNTAGVTPTQLKFPHGVLIVYQIVLLLLILVALIYFDGQ